MTRSLPRLAGNAVALLGALVLVPAAQAHGVKQHSSAPASRAAGSVDIDVSRDYELLDERGQPVRFHRDLTRGKIVAVTTIYTTCTTVCGIIGITLARLLEDPAIAARVGKDVPIVAVSVDPVVDGVDSLADWRRRVRAGSGLTLLTGGRAADGRSGGGATTVKELLQSLQMYTADLEAHRPVVLVGNADAGRWTFVTDITSPSAIASAIREASRP